MAAAVAEMTAVQGLDNQCIVAAEVAEAEIVVVAAGRDNRYTAAVAAVAAVHSLLVEAQSPGAAAVAVRGRTTGHTEADLVAPCCLRRGKSSSRRTWRRWQKWNKSCG